MFQHSSRSQSDRRRLQPALLELARHQQDPTELRIEGDYTYTPGVRINRGATHAYANTYNPFTSWADTKSGWTKTSTTQATAFADSTLRIGVPLPSNFIQITQGTKHVTAVATALRAGCIYGC
jgi:hypothetical protein